MITHDDGATVVLEKALTDRSDSNIRVTVLEHGVVCIDVEGDGGFGLCAADVPALTKIIEGRIES